MTTPRQERLINELCKNGDLESYREVLTALIGQIELAGASVSAKYNETPSNIDPSADRPKHIRVSLIEVKTPLNIIWNMLHEYGHYLDWPRNPTDSIIDRELTAWAKAKEIVLQHRQLEEHLTSFLAQRKWCLETYYKKYGYPQNWG